jgi:hypothetical protein
MDNIPRRSRAVLLSASKRKIHEVQSFTLKVVNNTCSELKALMEGPRLERRVNLTLVVLIIPMERKQPQIKKCFSAVTKEFSTTGISLVLDSPRPLDNLIVGLRWEGEMRFIAARVCHLHPLGEGFYQLGLDLQEMVRAADYPALEKIGF